MSDLPRVTVTLPGGRRVPGRLLRRERRDGDWVYIVVLDVPAAAVAPLPGEDYDDVPRGADPAGWVVQTLPGGRLEVHAAGCWLPDPGPNVRPVDAAGARVIGGEVCPVCRARP